MNIDFRLFRVKRTFVKHLSPAILWFRWDETTFRPTAIDDCTHLVGILSQLQGSIVYGGAFFEPLSTNDERWSAKTLTEIWWRMRKLQVMCLDLISYKALVLGKLNFWLTFAFENLSVIRDPFLESPGNLTGPKPRFKLKT